jgi:hypothetical protein
VKPLIFSRHAEQACRERELRIEAAEREPDWRKPDPSDPAVERRFVAIAGRDGRILRVACIETADAIRIITAFLDRKARKPT